MFCCYVVNVYVMFLFEFVNFFDFLFKMYWILWQVIVDYVIVKLQVDFFVVCFSCNQDLDFFVEKIFYLVFFFVFKFVFEWYRVDVVLLKKLLQVNLGGLVFCENNDFIVYFFDQVNYLKCFRVLCYLIDVVY